MLADAEQQVAARVAIASTAALVEPPPAATLITELPTSEPPTRDADTDTDTFVGARGEAREHILRQHLARAATPPRTRVTTPPSTKRGDTVPALKWRPDAPAADAASTNGTAPASGTPVTNGTAPASTTNGASVDNDIVVQVTKTRRRFLIFGRAR